jgi:glycosyltransferase involved in cell wall biosynthesis
MARLAILYQHMSPTRVPVFDRLYETLGSQLNVFYPAVLEGDRNAIWKCDPGHPYQLLKPRSFSYSLFSMRRYVHINPDVWTALSSFDPDCVIVYGFHPTALLAWAYTRWRKKCFIVATDGCLRSDRHNTPFHRWLRKRIIPTAAAAVGTSQGSQDLFNQYADFRGRYFNCYLCADNERFARYRHTNRQYDVMFAGQLIDRKLPHFFVDVVAEIKKKRPHISAVIMGKGPLRDEIIARLEALKVQYRYTGFVTNEELPAVYASARLFLFPSKLDAYGVVANEALAVGTPVICNEEPGAAGEVVLHGKTGYVLPLDVMQWAKHSLELLEDDERRRAMADAGYNHIQHYNFDTAAQGLKAAFERALSG